MLQDAEKAWKEANDLIQATGYHRRDGAASRSFASNSTLVQLDAAEALAHRLSA